MAALLHSCKSELESALVMTSAQNPMRPKMQTELSDLSRIIGQLVTQQKGSDPFASGIT